MPDYYELLQISPSASPEIVKAAYRAMSKLYHPDTTKFDKAFAEQKMKDLNEAYQILSDPVQRAEYDKQFKQSARSAPGGVDSTHTGQSEPAQAHTPEPPSPERQEHHQTNCGHRRRSRFGDFLGSVVQCITDNYQRNCELRDNAYIDGSSMENWDLVQRFQYSTGAERLGYRMVLEERGLLVRNDDNMLEPNDEFKMYWD